LNFRENKTIMKNTTDVLEYLNLYPAPVVGGLDENTEEDTGAYIAKGDNKDCSLQLEGGSHRMLP